MTRKELAQLLSEKEAMPKTKAESVIGTITSLIVEALENGDEVLLKGFGRFTTRTTKAKKGYNFQKGKVIDIKSRRMPVFRFAKKLCKDGI